MSVSRRRRISVHALLLKLCACLFLSLTLFVHATIQASDPGERPNILVIMVDDLGYSDLGCYGGEIQTPHLDSLAENGLRFSQFYNTAKCHSSRVSLLSGQYCIAAGDTSLSHAVTSAEVLRNAGYFTAMTGKWHLKKEPTDFGFDRYFGHLSGACNYFYGDKSFRLNGEAWNVPDEGFYTTVANVNYALQFLKEARKEKQPWYLYVAFNAPHAPLHALTEDYAKYKGQYASGWDVARAKRVAKQKQIGLLPESLTESPRPEHVPAWTDLDSWRQEYEANRMSTLAAMIDRVDQEVGRMVTDLQSHDELDNTFILFVSDNGACPYDRRSAILNATPTNGDVAFGDSTGWSWARNTPFRYYKQNQFEGGISTPGIVHWPKGLKAKPGSIIDEPAHLIDVLPTLADITSSPIPTEWPTREVRPVSGVSLKPLLNGKATLDREEPIHLLFSSDRGLRDGDWKAVSFRQEEWELYNMADDRTELNDLADSQPDRLNRMVETWTNMTRDVLHASPRSYAPVNKAKLPHLHLEWTNFASKDPPNLKKKAAKKSSKKPANHGKQKSIRARKNTSMRVNGQTMHLTFTGEDPGIAMDNLRGIPVGPYQLTFKLVAQQSGGGELFFTTDDKTTLPKGTRVPFEVRESSRAEDVSIHLDTRKQIFKLRLDVSDGPGVATISNLTLRKGDQVLKTWPAE